MKLIKLEHNKHWQINWEARKKPSILFRNNLALQRELMPPPYLCTNSHILPNISTWLKTNKIKYVHIWWKREPYLFFLWNSDAVFFRVTWT